MAAILPSIGTKQISDDEPPPRIAPFSAAGGGLHYVWGGGGSGEKRTTLYSYDPLTKLWRAKEITGAHHPGYYGGGCVFLNGALYTFGGYDGNSYHNTISKLNLESGQWSQEAGSGDAPMRKRCCGLVAVDETTLCCFGGIGTGPKQPGSTFIHDKRSSDGIGWTNECHLFNTREGIWSSPEIKGDRPPPCAGFSFTKVDQHRAVLFGGWEPSVNQRVSSLYEFNFKNKEITIKLVESSLGEPWPVERSCHSACYGEGHSQLLVFGGVGNDGETLRDMWILDVDNHHWTQVSLPESVKNRYLHSLTAITVAPGQTEVLLFGRRLKYKDRSTTIAETTILKYECSPGSRQWTLVDVADNSTRALHQQRDSQKRDQSTQQLLEQKTREIEQLRRRAEESEQRLQTTQQELEFTRDKLDSTQQELTRLAVRKLHPAIGTPHNQENQSREMKPLTEYSPGPHIAHSIASSSN